MGFDSQSEYCRAQKEREAERIRYNLSEAVSGKPLLTQGIQFVQE